MSARTSWGAAVLLAGALAAAGCGTAGQSGGRAGAPSPAPAASSAAPPALAPALVELSVTGGLAGVRDVVLVREDGTYSTYRKGGKQGSGRMTPAELNRLRDALEAARFPTLPREATPAPVADGFTYRITHRGHAVTTADPVPLPELGAVLSALPDR
ncbi:hypothetical protein [Streptomyces sp. t39]|uniref:hypothetical protein n=1 Tax=Streptomyces sp. t39 TaxID=1828156 RepID=UPI0011CE51B7|nr:hypothetical protein [Streptomyces sp. t39]TXS50104.1 hypothetical protein EAO77_28255 [Streptomyces sp. t39]